MNEKVEILIPIISELKMSSLCGGARVLQKKETGL